MKKLLLLPILFCALPAFSQSCSPFGGVGNVQFLDNLGNVLTNGVLYAFQAGTSTQQATFTDSTCTVTNVNPLTFGTGARAAIWLTTANTYKFVLCAQNDGSSCAGGDILFSVDNVPGGVTGGGGGASAPFITNSANPATSGTLRLASSDAICWRNTANSANLCFTKSTADILSWAGGSLLLPEVGAPTSVVGSDIIYADSTAHRYKQCSNGVACAQIVDAGVDVNTSDQVTQLHFGSTATPLSGTAPTTNQLLGWNGTNIIGTNTVTTPTINGGIVHGGTGFQHFRASTCTTPANFNGGCGQAYNWPSTWADTNYTFTCTIETGNIFVGQGTAKSTTQISLNVYNSPGSSTAASGTVDCIGVHD